MLQAGLALYVGVSLLVLHCALTSEHRTKEGRLQYVFLAFTVR